MRFVLLTSLLLIVCDGCNSARSKHQGQNEHPTCSVVQPSKDATPTWRVPFGIGYVFLGMIFVRFSGDSGFIKFSGFLCALLGGAFILNGYVECQPNNKDQSGYVIMEGSWFDYKTQTFVEPEDIDPEKILPSIY